VTLKHLDYCLDEFTFRFNRRRYANRRKALLSLGAAGRRHRPGTLQVSDPVLASPPIRVPSKTAICGIYLTEVTIHFRNFGELSAKLKGGRRETFGSRITASVGVAKGGKAEVAGGKVRIGWESA
jgi:hypothetical protein